MYESKTKWKPIGIWISIGEKRDTENGKQCNICASQNVHFYRVMRTLVPGYHCFHTPKITLTNRYDLVNDCLIFALFLLQSNTFLFWAIRK